MSSYFIRLIAILCALLIGVAMGPALSSPRHAHASTAHADTSPPITIGPVEGQFYENCCDNGVVDINYNGQVDTPLFTEQFPVIDFNPPQDAQVACSNSTGVNEYSRPMVDVIPQADGTCKSQTIEGGGYQAGVNFPSDVGVPGSFEAAFHSTLTVPSAGEVTFNIYSDDGWLLGIGTNVSGLQPSYVSGALDNPRTQTPVYHLTVVGAHNLPTSPAQRTVTVNFPAAGTYPMELDYTECCGGQLSLVLGSSFRNPIPPTQPSTQRKIVFVHGIRADFRKIIAGNDYSGMTTMLQNDYRDVSVFPYYQDVGYAQGENETSPCVTSGSGAVQQPDLRNVAAPPNKSIVPVITGPSSINNQNCDSQSDLGINATMLDDTLNVQAADGKPIAVMAHSMGGAITRGWLTLAQRERMAGQSVPALDHVDTVITFQGAQQGSWAAGYGESLLHSKDVDKQFLGNTLAYIASNFAHLHANRPAVPYLTPRSEWYRSINRQPVPTNINYFNFYSDMQVTPTLYFGPYTKEERERTRSFGDLVMLPGDDNPAAIPSDGGAKFFPPTNGDRYEWALTSKHDLFVDYSDSGSLIGSGMIGLNELTNDPINHLNLGGRLADPSVTVPDCQNPSSKVTIFAEFEHILADPAHACPRS